MFLRNSEKFALLVAQNLNEDEPSLTIESQNIGKVLSLNLTLHWKTILYAYMCIVIVAQIEEPNNSTGVTFPDPNIGLNNSIFILSSYIRQRSNEASKFSLL